MNEVSIIIKGVRYMLHKKAVLEDYDKPLHYVVKKFNFEDCYKKYEQDSN